RLRMRVAQLQFKLDDAIAIGQRAFDGYRQRGRVAQAIEAGLAVLELRDRRLSTADIDYIDRSDREWRQYAARELGADHPVVRKVDVHSATQAFYAGDVAGAHARLEQLRVPAPYLRSRRLAGR